MKHFLLLITALLGICMASLAQKNDHDPVTWNVHLKKIDDNTFQVIAEAEMRDGFHIWALDAGGDGSLINTGIVVDDELDWVEDQWQSNKPPRSETYEFIEGRVNYFEKQVQLSRTFKAKAVPANVTGTVTYQSCNETMCLPPKDHIFSLRQQ